MLIFEPLETLLLARCEMETTVQTEGDDFALLHRWSDGEARAAEILIERYFPALYRFFSGKWRQGCDDLVQDTFLGCLEARERFRGTCTFRTFLFSVARNVLYVHCRRRNFAGKDPSTPSAVLDPATSVTQRIFRHEEDTALTVAIERLPLQEQIILSLVFWEGLSGPEVATVLEVPLDTAYTKIRRAKERLRRLLAAPPSDDPLSARKDGSAARRERRRQACAPPTRR
jgi:RNA polymerase sigma-70 factor (ECF subfamily)